MLDYYGADTVDSLEGKIAVITGGASGIGYETARFFSKKGVSCILADLNPRVSAIADELGMGHIGLCGDILDEGFRSTIIEVGIKAFGRIDILINSAGIVALEAAEDISAKDWDRTISVNLTASFMMAQSIGRYMINQKIPGVLINLASQAGVIALDRHVAYCASKGGIIAMTKVLAYEWGKYGIRVNCVSPTVVLTQLGHQAWDGPAGEKLLQEMPSGRFAEPDEIANTIAYLCSNGAAMITGHNLVIDGGYTIK